MLTSLSPRKSSLIFFFCPHICCDTPKFFNFLIVITTMRLCEWGEGNEWMALATKRLWRNTDQITQCQKKQDINQPISFYLCRTSPPAIGWKSSLHAKHKYIHNTSDRDFMVHTKYRCIHSSTSETTSWCQYTTPGLGSTPFQFHQFRKWFCMRRQSYQIYCTKE